MIFQSSYAWQYGMMEMQSKIGALPISPVEGEAGHTEGHATLHELLNEYVPNPSEGNTQIWQKTGENTWEGEGTTPDYDDAGLQDYLSSMEDYYVQSFGKSPLFYIVNDNTGTDTSYTDTVSIPVGSKMYVGTKGLLSYIDNIAQENSRLRTDLVNLTTRIEALENPAE